jgi:hypothetical protein
LQTEGPRFRPLEIVCITPIHVLNGRPVSPCELVLAFNFVFSHVSISRLHTLHPASGEIACMIVKGQEIVVVEDVGQLEEHGKEACGVNVRKQWFPRSWTKIGQCVLPSILVYSTQKLHVSHNA